MRFFSWQGCGVPKLRRLLAQCIGTLCIIFSSLIISQAQASSEQAEYTKELQQLKQQLEEWERLKPAIKRLLSNEADLEFLIQELSKLSEIKNSPRKPVNNMVTGTLSSESSLNRIEQDLSLYAVHLASFSNMKNIKSSWEGYKKRYPTLFLSGQALKVSFVKGRKEYLRLIHGPYLSRKEANSICEQLKLSKQYCAVVGYSGEEI